MAKSPAKLSVETLTYSEARRKNIPSAVYRAASSDRQA